MKRTITRALVASAITALVCGGALAQGTTPARPAAATSTAARPAGPLPVGRVAVMDFDAFPARILQMKKVYTALETQFAGPGKDLQSLQDRLASLEAQAKQGTATAQQQQQMAQQYESLKKEFDRKKEDLDLAARRAYELAMTPIQERMNTAINEFARQRGIVIVVNLAQARQSGSLLYFSPATDITNDFIEEYNKKNP